MPFCKMYLSTKLFLNFSNQMLTDLITKKSLEISRRSISTLKDIIITYTKVIPMKIINSLLNSLTKYILTSNETDLNIISDTINCINEIYKKYIIYIYILIKNRCSNNLICYSIVNLSKYIEYILLYI